MLRNRTNGKCYIGQTRKAVNLRFSEHKAAANGNDSSKVFAITKAIRKYGWEAFDKFILEQCADQESLDASEDYWISRYETLAPNGYNLKGGGLNRSGVISEETREKLRHAFLGRRHSEDSKAKIGLAHKGKVCRPATPEEIEANRQRGLGKKHSDQAIAKMSGDNCHSSKLTAVKVVEIRRRYENGETDMKLLSEEYAVSPAAIWKVVTRRSWTSV